ncbi:MAG: DinB family protein [Gemmatimonadota bacterium]|nr:DinB family protein [Gemmatimonadota bacterium]
MKSLWQDETRRELKQRLGQLSEEKRPLWGKMNALQVVAHLTLSMRMATGELPTARKSTPVGFFPANWIVIHWLPWPHSTPTAPELLAGKSTTWTADVATLDSLIDGFGALDQKRPWPVHPAFGKLSAKSWGALGWKHIDHHLRQFGV